MHSLGKRISSQTKLANLSPACALHKPGQTGADCTVERRLLQRRRDAKLPRPPSDRTTLRRARVGFVPVQLPNQTANWVRLEKLKCSADRQTLTLRNEPSFAC